MNTIKGIFACYSATPKEAELVINLAEKQTSSSCPAPEKRTFIKRSIGKNPILDLSMENTNGSSENTPKKKDNLEMERIRDQKKLKLLTKFL